jgi:hypothetical protein
MEAFRALAGSDFSPFTTLELAKAAARNQEKRVLELLSHSIN